LKVVLPTKTLLELTEAILPIRTEAKLTFGPDGLTTTIVDPARVAFASIVVSKDAFKTYDVGAGGDICLDLAKVADLLSSFSKEDVEITIENSKIVFKVGTHRLVSKLIDPTALEAPPNMPPFDFTTEMNILSADLLQVLKTARKVSEEFSIDCKDGVVTIRADGSIESYVANPAVDLTKVSDCHSKFQLSYLLDVGKVLARSDTINACIGSDYPMKLIVQVPNACVEYVFAPRVEYDE